MKSFVSYIMFIALFLLLGCSEERSVRYGEKRRICMFFSSGSNDVNTERLCMNLDKELSKRGVNIEESRMYLLSEPGPDAQRAIVHFLDSIEKTQPSIILVSGDQALTEILRCNHHLLRSLPIIFSGVRFFDEAEIEKRPNICGFVDTPDYFRVAGLIYSALGKIPVEMGRDTTEYALRAYAEVERQLKNTDVILRKESKNSDVKYLQNTDSLVFYSYPFCQMSGQQMYLHFVATHSIDNEVFLADRVDGVTMGLCSYSNMPIFTTVYELFDDRFNVVGGVFSTVDQLAREWAECVSKVLGGIPPSSLGCVQSRKDVVIDYQRYRAAGFSLDNLPRETVFVNRPLLDYHESEFIWGVVILTFLAVVGMFVVYVVVNRRHNLVYINGIKAEHENLLARVFPGSTCFFMRAGTLSFDERIHEVVHLRSDNRIFLLADFLALVHPDDVSQFDFLEQDHTLDDFHSVIFRISVGSKKYSWCRIDCRSVERGRETYLAGVMTSIDEEKTSEIRKSRIRDRAYAELAHRDELVVLSRRVVELLASLNELVLKLNGNLLTENERSASLVSFEALKKELLATIDVMSEKK